MYVNLELAGSRRAGARPRPEWTWDELLGSDWCAATTGSMRTATDSNDQYGISLTQWLQAVSPVDLAGRAASLLERTDRELAHGRAGARERALDVLASTAARRARRLVRRDVRRPAVKQGLFQAGRALFYGPVGYWETYRFQHIEDFRWDVLPLPRDRTSATCRGDGHLRGAAHARDPELAYDVPARSAVRGALPARDG